MSRTLAIENLVNLANLLANLLETISRILMMMLMNDLMFLVKIKLHVYFCNHYVAQQKCHKKRKEKQRNLR